MMTSLVDALRARVSQHPDRNALVFLSGDGAAAHFTYGQLDRDARRYAGLLRANGVPQGDLVIIACEHGYELAAAFWGTLYCGAVPTIFPYRDATGSGEARQRRMTGLATFTAAQALLCPTEAQAEVTGWLAGLATRALSLAEEAEPLAEALLSPRGGEEIAYIQFSSGATGAPKGVMLSHRAVLANVNAQTAMLSFNDRDVCVHWLPFYHDMGLLGTVFLPILTGALSVSMAPATWIRRPQLLFNAIDRYRGTMTWMPNFAFNHCLRTVRDEHLAGLDLSSWRILGNGSEPVQSAMLQRFAERFAPWGLDPAALTVGYGMAEDVVVISMTPLAQTPKADFVAQSDLQTAQHARPAAPEQPGVTAIASCGLPAPGVAVQIVDDAGQPLPERQVGEVLIAGHSLFSGYFGDAERTAQSLRDGWFHTGDLGYMADGELYICGRLKDLIIVGGQNIHPESIEALAQEILGDEARKVAAFGVPDEEMGTEQPVLVCELRGSPNDANHAQLAEQLRERVWMELGVTLADVRFVRGIVERTTSGKVARSATREAYLAAGYRPQPAASTLSPALLADPAALEAALLALACQMLGATDLSSQDNLFDAGADSLTMLRMGLQVEERLDVRVSTDFFRMPTIGHLVQLLAGENPPPAALAVTVPVTTTPAAPTAPRRPVVPPVQRWARRVAAAPQRVRLLVRSRFEAKALSISYFEGIRWLLDWCGRPWVQGLLYPQESQLVRRFAASMGTPAAQVNQEVALSLASHIIRAKKKSGLMPGAYIPLIHEPVEAASLYAVNEEAWGRYFDLEGAAFLEDVIQHDHGVICVGPHTPTRFAARQYMKRHVERLLAVNHPAYRSAWQDLLAGQGISFAEGKAAARTSVAMEAARTLSQGGVVGIAGDQEDVQAGLPVIIGDRLHHLVHGFAELAVATGACILPMYTQLLMDGRVRIRFLAPLTWDRRQARDEQIEQIVQAYAACQTELWRQAPGALLDSTIKRHLACRQVIEPSSG